MTDVNQEKADGYFACLAAEPRDPTQSPEWLAGWDEAQAHYDEPRSTLLEELPEGKNLEEEYLTSLPKLVDKPDETERELTRQMEKKWAIDLDEPVDKTNWKRTPIILE